jgi:hypothetical protein
MLRVLACSQSLAYRRHQVTKLSRNLDPERALCCMMLGLFEMLANLGLEMTQRCVILIVIDYML